MGRAVRLCLAFPLSHRGSNREPPGSSRGAAPEGSELYFPHGETEAQAEGVSACARAPMWPGWGGAGDPLRGPRGVRVSPPPLLAPFSRRRNRGRRWPGGGAGGSRAFRASPPLLWRVAHVNLLNRILLRSASRAPAPRSARGGAPGDRRGARPVIVLFSASRQAIPGSGWAVDRSHQIRALSSPCRLNTSRPRYEYLKGAS